MTLTNHMLVIMAKAPRPGAAKTRLAEYLSLHAVTELYRCLLNNTIALAQVVDHVDIAIMCPASTHDGGYYLVGARASHPGLFTSDGMGTASALEALLTRARPLGLSVHLTDPFYDIDVAADLSHLAEELQRMPGKAPRTAKWLSEWASAECE
jgi:glycosyltransferase A (GT-A) superfamily protein (DUF2064 family)